MNPFIEIFRYIKTELKNKYPALAECYMYPDIEDDKYKKYYIKYKDNLSVKESRNLYHNIKDYLNEFCNKNGYQEALEYIVVSVSRLM